MNQGANRLVGRIALLAWLGAAFITLLLLPTTWLEVTLEEGWLISSIDLSGNQLLAAGFPLLAGAGLAFVLALIFKGSPRFFALIASLCFGVTLWLLAALVLASGDELSAVPLEIVRVLRAPLEASIGLSDTVAIAAALTGSSWLAISYLVLALLVCGLLGSLWFLVYPQSFASAMAGSTRESADSRDERAAVRADEGDGDDPQGIWDAQDRAN